MDDLKHTEEVLGITRCARCGHRLEGEIECPFCTSLAGSSERVPLPKWIYLTACFLTSPLSIYFIFRSDRLRSVEKVLALSGCLLWFFLYRRISGAPWFPF